MGKPISFLAQVTNKIARNKEGAGLTHKARLKALTLVAKDLEKQFRIKDLNNLKQKHIQFIIDKWKSDGKTIGSIKNGVSHLRWLCEKIGKQTMMPRTNAELGIDQRNIDYNSDKAWSPSPEFKESLPETQRFHVELMREFGMRFQEAAKFRPSENVHDGKISIIYGTKGGRDRDLEFKYEKGLGEARDVAITSKQQEVLDRLQSYLSRNNVESLSRFYEKYKNFENNTRYIYREFGMTKNGIGTPHGLRHQYGQDRYRELTGWNPPAAMEDQERKEFRASMGKDQRETDRSARQTIAEELGHGRAQVTSNYVGSWL